MVAPAPSTPLPQRGRGTAADDGRASERTQGEAEIWQVLATIPDPEIPAVTLVDLGIIRRVEGGRVVITPTYSGCPATLVIETMIRDALAEADLPHTIITELAPAWTTDWITPEGRAKLRAYGIAPPPEGAATTSLKNAQAAECPRCGSHDTLEVSRFGSTPCKALWRCRTCAEPFDRFKCH